MNRWFGSPPVKGWSTSAVCLTVSAALTASLCSFFNLQIQNRWTVLFGDRLDAEIEATILQHWFNVFVNHSGWATTNYFYPYDDALGYNDGYFVYGLIFSIFRLLGANVFSSTELVNVVVKSIGFLGFYWTLRSVASVPILLSLVGAIVFTISNNTYVQAIHAQLFSVGFAPLLVAVLFQGFRASRSGMTWQGAFWCAASAVCYSAWLMTAFYMAWFFTFFCGSVILIYIALNPGDLRRLWALKSYFAVPGIVGAVFLAFGLLPFALVYLPKAAETGMHPFTEAMTFSPSIFDTINVGPDNLLFGRLSTWFNHLMRPSMPQWGERMSGLPPIIVFLFVCTTIWLWAAPSAKSHKFARAIATATAATWLLSLHFGTFAPWRWVYSYVPGAAAVRVIARYQIFLVFPVVALVMIWLHALEATLGGALLLVVSVLLIVEEINGGYPIGLSPAIEMARLTAVPPTPADCQAFATTGVRPGPPAAPPETDAVYSSNVDAMMIAEYIRLPTINGMASFVPPDWDFSDPARSDYLARIGVYIGKHHIRNLCLLDLRTLVWISR